MDLIFRVKRSTKSIGKTILPQEVNIVDMPRFLGVSELPERRSICIWMESPKNARTDSPVNSNSFTLMTAMIVSAKIRPASLEKAHASMIMNFVTFETHSERTKLA